MYGEVTEPAEGVRLLSVCRSKAYRGFESLPLRHILFELGSRQAVRHQVLVLASGGSNPPCPANIILMGCRLMVGQRILVPYVGVQVLPSQPFTDRGGFLPRSVFLCLGYSKA